MYYLVIEPVGLRILLDQTSNGFLYLNIYSKTCFHLRNIEYSALAVCNHQFIFFSSKGRYMCAPPSLNPRSLNMHLFALNVSLYCSLNGMEMECSEANPQTPT